MYFIYFRSDSGIVNVYETSEAKSSHEPKPVAVNKSLVTSCEAITFNHDSQILAVGSSVKVCGFFTYWISSLGKPGQVIPHAQQNYFLQFSTAFRKSENNIF